MTDQLDPFWEQKIYSQGKHLNRYPYDSVVTFVFRNSPSNRERSSVRILEVGCGAGNNLWFAAREGFSITGIDGSSSAITAARERFAEEGLAGEFHVGDFRHLPFADNQFDLVIDRAAITYAGRADAMRIMREIHRVLVVDGRHFFNPYAVGDVSQSASQTEITHDKQIRFYSRKDVEELFADGWKILSLRRLEEREEIGANPSVLAQWRVIVQKNGSVSLAE